MTSTLTAMTFNLRHHRDGKRGWPERRQAVRDIVARRAPDLLGTQEGLLEQVLDIHEALPHHAVVGEGRRRGRCVTSGQDGCDEDEYVALFYDTRRFDMLDHGNFWFSDTPEVPGSMGWGNYVPRMTTWARLADRETGRPFTFVNTHLDHFHPRARTRGASLLRERFPPANGEPMLLVGDFNSIPRRFVHRHLTEDAGFQDSFHLARERSHRFGGSFHGFTGRGLMRLDWILCRPRWEVHRHVTVRDRPNGVHPSDHFPVLAELALPAEQTVSLVPEARGNELLAQRMT